MSEALAIAEWQRGEACRQVARLCLQHGFYADAVSRAYYAAFHAAKAPLALYDISTRNHRGVNSLFSLQIVKPGLVEDNWGSVIGQLSPLRIAADYRLDRVFSETDAVRACARADDFVTRIHALLTSSIAPERLR